MKATAGIDEMDGHVRILSREGIPANEVNSSGRQRAFPYEGKVAFCFSPKSRKPDEVERWISAGIHPQPAEHPPICQETLRKRLTFPTDATFAFSTQKRSLRLCLWRAEKLRPHPPRVARHLPLLRGRHSHGKPTGMSPFRSSSCERSRNTRQATSLPLRGEGGSLLFSEKQRTG